jgi:PAP2 superfamily
MSGPAPRSHRRAPLVAGAAAGLLLIALTIVVVLDGGRPFGWDGAVHEWARQVRAPAVTTAARRLTATGTGLPAFALAATAGALGGGRRRWWAGALIASAGLAAVQLLRLALSAWIVRPRPPSADWATTAGGFSFPSGHTTTSAAVAVLLVVALRRRTTSRAVRTVGTAAALAWAVGVGVTRVYLGVHWPSDVLAGWLLVLTICGAAAGWAATAVRR